jgi:pilus assembly protein CpaB
MKRPQIIGLAVALSAGLVAFVLVRGMINRPPVETRVEVHAKSSEVLVAAAEIGLGQVVTPTMLRWQAWPAEAVAQGYIGRASDPEAMNELAGSIARTPFLAGEPVTSQKLVKPGQGGVLAAILPAGMRAVSTKIKEETAAGNLILPNDRVDVILIRRVRDRAGQEDYVSDVLFGNVRVLAVGQQIETKEGKKQADSSASTATLELTARQAELLALANSMGEISLSLRSIADVAAGSGSENGEDLKASKDGRAVRVLRYGVGSRAYSVN